MRALRNLLLHFFAATFFRFFFVRFDDQLFSWLLVQLTDGLLIVVVFHVQWLDRVKQLLLYHKLSLSGRELIGVSFRLDAVILFELVIVDVVTTFPELVKIMRGFAYLICLSLPQLRNGSALHIASSG